MFACHIQQYTRAHGLMITAQQPLGVKAIGVPESV